MAEIEDLQVELESIICVQKLERLIDLAKYFKLEIYPEVKTKLCNKTFEEPHRGNNSESARHFTT